MLTYITILQHNLPNNKNIHYPVHKVAIYKTTLYKTNTKYWPTIYQASPGSKNQIKILYYIFIESITKPKVLKSTPHDITKEKYHAYKTLVRNIFLTPETKQEIQTVFERTQRYYFILRRFLKTALYRKRPQPTYKITTDLSLQPLDPTSPQTFIVYESSTSHPQPAAYLFSIYDLIKIIQTAITNSSNFFEKPLQPKNPYTNIEFTEHTLYAFFYKLYKIRHTIPPILTKYYQEQFNLKMFLINNQSEIRDISIRNFVTNSPSNILYEEILDMIDSCFCIHECNPDMEIHIDPSYPKDKLIQIMRPYLYLYLLKDYYIYGSEKRILAKRLFRRAVNNFVIHNPRFGEKKSTLEKTTKLFNTNDKTSKNKESNLFFDDHPKFTMLDINTYLQDTTKLIAREVPRPPQPPPSNNQNQLWNDDESGSDEDI